MNCEKTNNFQVNFLAIEPNMNQLPLISQKNHKDIKFLTFKNTLSKKELQEKINSSNILYSMKINPPILIKPFLSLDEADENKKMIKFEYQNDFFNLSKKNLIFKVNYPENASLFTNSKRNYLLNEELFENKTNNTFLERKRKRRPRGENKDNIRRKIKRGFLNNGIIRKLNQKLKDEGSNLYFMKFPQSFVSDIFRKTNKEVVNMTLGQIFENKNVNVNKNETDLVNYYHNLKVVKSVDVLENIELQKILNKKYCDLFGEYLNSDEFIIEEVERLKKKNLNNDFIHRYIDISKHFIEFFSQ